MITEQFADLGEFLGAVIRYGASDGAEFDRRLVMAAVATGMNERVPSEGGAAVPEEQAGQIWERVNSVGQIIQRCTRQPITTRSDTLSFPSVGETSRVNGSRYGGLVLRWLDEAEAFPEFTPRFKGLQFAPNKLGGIVHVTGELMADAPALGAWFDDTAATEVAMIVEDCIVSGDGLGKPLGIVNPTPRSRSLPRAANPVPLCELGTAPRWRRDCGPEVTPARASHGYATTMCTSNCSMKPAPMVHRLCVSTPERQLSTGGRCWSVSTPRRSASAPTWCLSTCGNTSCANARTAFSDLCI